MKKKIIAAILVFMLISGFLPGCGQEEAPPQEVIEETAAVDEFTGKYSGDAGSITFEPGGTVLLNFTGEFTKYLKEYPNNTSYAYAFEDGGYADATAFLIYENEGDEFAITYFTYDLYEDKIVIFPTSMFEETFYKE